MTSRHRSRVNQAYRLIFSSILLLTVVFDSCCYGLAPDLRTATSDFKESYAAASICRTIEQTGSLDDASYLADILSKLDQLKEDYLDLSITTLPHEIVIAIPEDGVAVRYFDPSHAAIITPFTDVSKLRTKVINSNLCRQIIYRAGAIGYSVPANGSVSVEEPAGSTGGEEPVTPVAGDTTTIAIGEIEAPESVPPHTEMLDAVVGFDPLGWVIAIAARLVRRAISRGGMEGALVQKSVLAEMSAYSFPADIDVAGGVKRAAAEIVRLMGGKGEEAPVDRRDAFPINNVIQIHGGEWLGILTQIDSYLNRGYAPERIMELLEPRLKQMALLAESDFRSLEARPMREYVDLVRREGDAVTRYGKSGLRLERPDDDSLIFCPDRNSKAFLSLMQEGCRLKIAAGISAGGLSMRSKQKVAAHYRVPPGTNLIGGLTLWEIKKTVLTYYERLGGTVTKDRTYRIPKIIMVSPMRIRDTALSLGVDERAMLRAIHDRGYYLRDKAGEKTYVFSQPAHYFIGEDGQPLLDPDGNVKLHPSGQWNFLRMLAISGILADLKRDGVQYLFHSNITNLGARPEQAYAALLDREIKAAERQGRTPPVFLNLAVDNVGEQGACIFSAALEGGREGLAIVEGRAFPDEIGREVSALTRASDALTDGDKTVLAAMGMSDPYDSDARRALFKQKYPYYATGSFILSVDRLLHQLALPTDYDVTMEHGEIVRRVDAWTDRLGFTVQKRTLPGTDPPQEGYQFERPYGLTTAYWPWAPVIVDRAYNTGTFKREEDFSDEKKMAHLADNLGGVFAEIRRPGLLDTFNEEYGIFMPTKWMYHPERAGKMLEGRFQDILPLSVHLCPSLACNRKCYFCTFGGVKGSYREGDTRYIATHTPSHTSRMMGYDLLKKTIDDIRDAGIKAIIFSGAGEPLTYPHLVEAMEYCRTSGPRVDMALYTNGSLFTDESIERILDLDPVFIRVSLNDGSPELHRLVTGVDDFDRVWSNIEKLSRAKVRKGVKTDIAIGFVANVVNMRDLKKLALKLRTLAQDGSGCGVTSLQIRPTVNYESSKFYDRQRFEEIERYLIDLHGEKEGARYVASFRAYMYEDEQMPPWVIRQIKEIVDTEVMPLLRDTGIEVSFPRLKFDRLAEPNIKPFDKCFASPWVLDIWPNGDVIHCLEWCGTPGFEIGNIARQSLREILTGEQRRQVLSWVNEAVLCARCPAICAQYELNRVLADIKAGIEAGRREELQKNVERFVETHPAPRHINFLYPAFQPALGLSDVHMTVSFDGNGHADLRYTETENGRLPETSYANLNECLTRLAAECPEIPGMDIPLVISGSMEETAMVRAGTCYLSASTLGAPDSFLYGLLYHDLFLHLVKDLDEYDALAETARFFIGKPDLLARTIDFLESRTSPAKIIRSLFVPGTAPEDFPGIDAVFAAASGADDVREAIEALREILRNTAHPVFLRIRAALWLADTYGRQRARVEGKTPRTNEETGAYHDPDALFYYTKAFDLLKEEVKALAETRAAALPDGRALYATTLDEYAHRIPDGLTGVALEQPVRLELTSGVGSDLLSQLLLAPETSGCCNFSIDVKDPRSGRIAPPCHIAIEVIDKPVIEVQSIELGATEEIHAIDDVFDFSNGSGSIKAALVVSGLVSPYFRKSGVSLEDLLEKLTGSRGKGIRIVSHVGGVALHSGLAGSAAVQTGTVLALLKLCGLTEYPASDNVTDKDKARTLILSLYAGCLMGDPGGVQDACLMYPGVKNIYGRRDLQAGRDDVPGLLLPGIEMLDISPRMTRTMSDRLILIDGGMRQSSGDILRDQTASYYLGDPAVALARARSSLIHREQVANLRSGDPERAFERMSALEEEDWHIRNFISPRSSNEGIQEFLERLKAYCGERYRAEEARYGRKSFSFDSTGARGGAGCLFFLADWVDKDEFIRRALELFREVQAWLKTPQHEDRAGRTYRAWPDQDLTAPYVYEWQINRRGSDVRMKWAARADAASAADEARKAVAKDALRAAINGGKRDAAILVNGPVADAIDLMIWDFDGVIADTSGISAETTGAIYWRILNRVTEPGRMPEDSDEIYREGQRRYYELLPQPAAHMVIMEALRKAGLEGSASPSDYYTEFAAIRDAKLDVVLKSDPASTVMPYVQQLLEALQDAAPALECCINTSSDTAFFRKRFDGLPVKRFFSFERSLDAVERKKGDIDGQKIGNMERIIDEKRLPHGRVAIVDDSPSVITSAKKRMPDIVAIGIAPDREAAEAHIEAGADMVFLSLKPTLDKLEALGIRAPPACANRLLVTRGSPVVETTDPVTDRTVLAAIEDAFLQLDAGPGTAVTERLTEGALKHKALSFDSREREAKNAFTRGITRKLLTAADTRSGTPRVFGERALLKECTTGAVTISGPVDVTLRWRTRDDGSVELADARLEAGGGSANISKSMSAMEERFGLVALCGNGAIGRGWIRGCENGYVVPTFIRTETDSKANILHFVDDTPIALMKTVGEPLPEEAVQRLMRELDRMLTEAVTMKYIAITVGGRIVSDNSPELYRSILDIAHTHNVSVIIDFKSAVTEAEIMSVLSAPREKPVDIVTPNLEELAVIADRTGVAIGATPDTMTRADIESICRTVITRYNIAGVMVTMDRRGALLVLRDRTIRGEPVAVEEVSYLGAGDATNAGLMRALASGMSPEEALTEAIVFGAACVSSAGSSAGTKELIERLRDQARDAAVAEELPLAPRLPLDNDEEALLTGELVSIADAIANNPSYTAAIAGLKKLKESGSSIPGIDYRKIVYRGGVVTVLYTGKDGACYPLRIVRSISSREEDMPRYRLDGEWAVEIRGASDASFDRLVRDAASALEADRSKRRSQTGKVIDLRGKTAGKRVVVVSDLHGEPGNLEAILTEIGWDDPAVDKPILVINGDAVHVAEEAPGPRPAETNEAYDTALYDMAGSIAVIKRILELKARYPENVYYLVGNHDNPHFFRTSKAISQNTVFQTVLGEQFGEKNRQRYADLMDRSPLLFIADGVAVSHAGPLRGGALAAVAARARGGEGWWAYAGEIATLDDLLQYVMLREEILITGASRTLNPFEKRALTERLTDALGLCGKEAAEEFARSGARTAEEIRALTGALEEKLDALWDVLLKDLPMEKLLGELKAAPMDLTLVDGSSADGRDEYVYQLNNSMHRRYLAQAPVYTKRDVVRFLEAIGMPDASLIVGHDHYFNRMKEDCVHGVVRNHEGYFAQVWEGVKHYIVFSGGEDHGFCVVENGEVTPGNSDLRGQKEMHAGFSKPGDGGPALGEVVSHEAHRPPEGAPLDAATLGPGSCVYAVMAAGKGTRFAGDMPKCIYPVFGKPLARHGIDAARSMNMPVVTVVGYKAPEVIGALGDDITYVQQGTVDGRGQLGHGHAAIQLEKALAGYDGNIIIALGDLLGVDAQLLRRVRDAHSERRSAMSIVTMLLDDPRSFGRVLRNKKGEIERTIEQKEIDEMIASGKTISLSDGEIVTGERAQSIKEVVSGVYAFKAQPLFAMLKGMRPSEATGEYYLTDSIDAFIANGLAVDSIAITDRDAVRGINTLDELAAWEAAMVGKEAGEAVFGSLLGDNKPDVLLRVPVEAIEAMDIGNVICILGAFQEAPNGYVELYYMSGAGGVGEGVYRKYGLQKKIASEKFKDFKRSRENTVTLFAAMRGEEIDQTAVVSRLGSLEMTAQDTVLSPVSLQRDPTGLIRATLLGLQIVDLARQIRKGCGAYMTGGRVDADKVQEGILEHGKQVWDQEALRGSSLTPDDIIGLATGTINTVIDALKKLIELLPITPFSKEELRHIYEHAREVIRAA